jgi:hypothetical protein
MVEKHTLFRSHIAMRHVRMLLIRAGLSETDADAFLEWLEAELVAGHLEDREARLKLIERELAELSSSQRISKAILTDLAISIASGIASNALYDFLKSRFESSPVDAKKPMAGAPPRARNLWIHTRYRYLLRAHAITPQLRIPVSS